MVSLVVLVTGCTTVKGSLRTAGVATLGAMGGLAFAVTGEPAGCACPTPREATGAILFLGGGTVAVVSLIAAAFLAIDIDSSESAPAPTPAVVDDPLVIHERVWAMTREAAAMARAHHCEKVKAIELEVRGLDLEFHDTVFSRDAEVSTCLTR